MTTPLLKMTTMTLVRVTVTYKTIIIKLTEISAMKWQASNKVIFIWLQPAA